MRQGVCLLGTTVKHGKKQGELAAVIPEGQSLTAEGGGRGIQSGDVVTFGKYPPDGEEKISDLVEGEVAGVIAGLMLFKVSDPMDSQKLLAAGSRYALQCFIAWQEFCYRAVFFVRCLILST